MAVTPKDVKEAAGAIGREAYRVASTMPDDPKRTPETDPIKWSPEGPAPKSMTAKPPSNYYKGYGAYAPRYSNGGKKVGKKSGKRKRVQK